MAELIIFAIAFVATFVGVAAFRRWSVKAGLLDIPNDRSSHKSPTPRGAGLIIVAVSLLLYTYITLTLTNNFRWTYLAAACLVAIVSWLDDLYSVSFIIRLLVQSVAAALLIYGVGFWTEIYIPGFGLIFQVGNFGAFVAFLWVVWMINAYNFMDGIDGIAGSQGVVAGLAWLIFGSILGYQSTYIFGGVLAFSSLGFLIHNWSPAKVFMGDVGSAFLGFAFAALPLMAAAEKPTSSPIIFVTSIMFVWFFVFDTVYTFIGRVLRKEKVWAAHRGHLYQKITVGGSTHSSVTLLYTGFTVLVTVSFFVGLLFRGNWKYLTLFTTLVLSAVLVFFGHHKKSVDVSTGKC